MQADRVGGRDDRAGDDVVAVYEGASDRLTDAINVYRGSRNEGNDEGNSGGEQGGNHQHAEPAYIQAVVSAGDPVAKPIPCATAFASLNGCRHSGNNC